MSRKNLARAAAIAGVYVLLLWLLVLVESAEAKNADDPSRIGSFWTAFWYSLTTMTTVGYGDVYPHTVAGRIIGGVFQLCSLGLLVFLIGLLITNLRDRLLPRFILMRDRKQTWVVFDAYTEDAATLAKSVVSAHPGTRILFCTDATERKAEGLCLRFSAEELIAMHKAGSTLCLCMGGDDTANLVRAKSLSELGVKTFAKTKLEPETATEHVTLFHPDRCRARLYWRQYPVEKKGETIVIVGGGEGAQRILEQGLLVNCFSTQQHLTYRLFSFPDEFFAAHPYLSELFSVGSEDSTRDSILHTEAPWSVDFDAVRTADRIIVCGKTESETNSLLSEIQCLCPVQGRVYACTNLIMDGVIQFGCREEIFTAELVMQMELDRTARAMHERYRKEEGNSVPAWDALGTFLRDSNRAVADHLPVKCRVLLGSEKQGAYKAAYEAFRSASPEQIEQFRRIEHERWCRFHLLHNWRYAPIRDNAKRLHPAMVPFDQLSKADQKKDDLAWEILGTIS